MPKAELTLIDSYGYPPIDWAKCQLEIEGKICNEPHGIGWIMMRRDGVEGYIGGKCAKRHFKADKVFASAVSKARKDIYTGNLRTRLGRLVQDREALRRRILDELARQQMLRKKVGVYREMLPYPVLERLHQMSKTGDRNIRVEFGDLERDEDRNQKVIEVIRWRTEVVSAVTAPQALDVGAIESIGTRLRNALGACIHADPNSVKPDKDLLRWANEIEDVDRCESEVNERISLLEPFAQAMNISHLCWVCRKDEDQVKVARAVLKLSGSRDVSDVAAVKVRDAWRNEMVATRKAARLRIL